MRFKTPKIKGVFLSVILILGMTLSLYGCISDNLDPKPTVTPIIIYEKAPLEYVEFRELSFTQENMEDIKYAETDIAQYFFMVLVNMNH